MQWYNISCYGRIHDTRTPSYPHICTYTQTHTCTKPFRTYLGITQGPQGTMTTKLKMHCNWHGERLPSTKGTFDSARAGVRARGATTCITSTPPSHGNGIDAYIVVRGAAAISLDHGPHRTASVRQQLSNAVREAQTEVWVAVVVGFGLGRTIRWVCTCHHQVHAIGRWSRAQQYGWWFLHPISARTLPRHCCTCSTNVLARSASKSSTPRGSVLSSSYEPSGTGESWQPAVALEVAAHLLRVGVLKASEGVQ